jgi:uncharacterized protein YcgI (DUF1989 family)
MAVIVAVTAVPHRLDPRPDYTCGKIRVIAWRDVPAGDDDNLRHMSPEGRRAFENTDAFGGALEVRA